MHRHSAVHQAANHQNSLWEVFWLLVSPFMAFEYFFRFTRMVPLQSKREAMRSVAWWIALLVADRDSWDVPRTHISRTWSARSYPHMSDSIQGTDYIATYFFLNLKISRAKIENLKWQIGGDIIPLTFGTFVALLVQKLKTLREKTDM